MTTYRTKWGSDDVVMLANFAEASCPIDGDQRGRQVADFRHRPEAAMRAILEDEASDEGFDAESPETIEMIDDAVAAMTEDI